MDLHYTPAHPHPMCVHRGWFEHRAPLAKRQPYPTAPTYELCRRPTIVAWALVRLGITK